jgi:Uma2 family endonuclease
MIEVTQRGEYIGLPYIIRFPNITEEQFEELADKETKAELFDGVMIVHSAISLWEDELNGFLRGLMDLYADIKGLGEVLGSRSVVRLTPRRLLSPMAYFIRKGRRPERGRKYFAGAPDLVVETLSPPMRDYALKEKRPAYRKAGVREIWFVDPQEYRVIVDRKRGKQYHERKVSSGKLRSEVLEGFWIEADWLWLDGLPGELECLSKILGTDWQTFRRARSSSGR